MRLAAVLMLRAGGMLPRARAVLTTETAYPQQSTAWKGVPRELGPSAHCGWKEWLALVIGALMGAFVVGLAACYGSPFPHLPLIFPIPPLSNF